MIFLDATTKLLQFKLSAAVTTNQLPFSVSYYDTAGSGQTPIELDGVSNNTTAVTLVPAPSSHQIIENITIQNADTAPATVTIILNNNSTLRNIFVATLAVGDQLIYEDGNGWNCVDKNGNIKSSGSSSGGVTSVSNSDGTLTISPATGSVVASLASLSSGDILVGNGSNVATACAVSGDATLSNTGALTVTKTSGTAFGPYATATQGQLPGTTTNDNASTGNVGEFISANQTTAVSLTSGVETNVTSITLTAGDWDVWGNTVSVPSITATTTAVTAGVSTTSASFQFGPTTGSQSTWYGNQVADTFAYSLAPIRISTASNATLYLVYWSLFSGSTSSVKGYIAARRVR